MSSTISDSISASAAVSRLDSLVWKTTFSIFLTFVGEPTSPSCVSSGSTSAAASSTICKYRFRRGHRRSHAVGSGRNLGLGLRELVLHHALGILRTAFGRRAVDGHHQRQRAFDDLRTVFQTALDNQRVRLDFEQLLGIGHLRPAQLLGHLRPHLRRIAVDRLTACDDHVGTDFAHAHDSA